MSELKALVAGLLKLQTEEFRLRTDEGELTETEILCSAAGITEGTKLTVDYSAAVEESLGAKVLEFARTRAGAHSSRTKVQWLSLLLEQCRAGNSSAMLHTLSDYAQLSESHSEEELIDQGDAQGWTCLHYATHLGQAKIVKMLCGRSACPNLESRDHWTPLQLAAYHGALDCVKTLLKHEDIQVNRMTETRGSALHLAALQGHAQVVEFLLENGAEMT